MSFRIKGNYHPIKEENIKKGDEAEDRLLNTMREWFDEDLVKDPNPYAIIDYLSDKTLVELKSRNIYYKTFSTTMVGLNKINYCLKANKISYFVFEFKDGLYYWKLSKKDLKTFEIKMGGTAKRGEIESQMYVYIPITSLIKMDKSGGVPPSVAMLIKCCIEEEPEIKPVKQIINQIYC